MKRRDNIKGMFEFVFVCTCVYAWLGIREQEGLIDTCFADNERANASRILESGCCNELVDWATRVYHSPGMM